MKYYLEITLLPDAEANLGFLWYKVFQQIHIALVDNKIGENQSAVALSIPGYQSGDSNDKAFPLGSKLRLFAESEAILANLDIQKWLNRLRDYVQVASITAVPNSVSYVGFRKKRVKGKKRLEQSLHKKAKHLSNKFNLDFDKTLQMLEKKHSFNEEKLPFVHIESQSSVADKHKPRFKLFIEKVESAAPQQGIFDCYGLSKTATVPWF
ncbi:type I-F CRISPR-associated endoribonuclease Cas6/Csy4 [Ostreibacterium oceani]|uniref:Type I-F CRISPR-associated endoribonuclease Cas6/Csy4 n=1 Tax=Ostreibacterium oceani TaxID=2654998 RepID=A0A6N7EU09_9GAMM|nr:type I-F CRISPR-associated endoribonuclease Cas6/Csy4 [Ostreibacterium oceani]MPV85912.1 type I-F CRISPR-associated endoribonuclease Cas6/Csy4 [Ostreibacterium oceani]